MRQNIIAKLAVKAVIETEQNHLEDIIKLWLDPMPHFGGGSGHRFNGLASEYADTKSKAIVCVYCLRPKQATFEQILKLRGAK